MFIRSETFKHFIQSYPIISSINIIHIVLFLLISSTLFPSRFIFELFTGVNLYIYEGEYWRLITPLFVHNGFSHLLFNSMSLLLFGPALEKWLGGTKFLLLYLSTGILANIATFLLQPLPYTHVGASGAIFGLFGFYLAITIFFHDAISKQNAQLIITISVISVIMTFIQPQINVIAHLFGLISGFTIGFIAGKKQHASFHHYNWIKPKEWFQARGKISRSQFILFLILIVLMMIGILANFS